jgi:hypothetical protein
MTTTANDIKLTKEEAVWLMKAQWKAMQTADWDKSISDLQKIKEALKSGKDLKDLTDDQLDCVYPLLKPIALHLGAALKAKAYADEAASAPPAQSPAAPPPAAPAPIPAPRLQVVATPESATSSTATAPTEPAAATEKA